MISRCSVVRKLSFFVSLAFILLLTSGAIAANLIIEDGKLVGAKDILVDGQFLDVSFVDGSCISEFQGCDNVSSDFFFTTKAGAAAASLALMEQVFLDVGAGAFDTTPELTAGCSSGVRCLVYTPFDIGEFAGLQTFSALLARNYSNESSDAADTLASSVGSFERSFDYELSGIVTLAQWQVSEGMNVPIPMLYSGGLLLLLIAVVQYRSIGTI